MTEDSGADNRPITKFVNFWTMHAPPQAVGVALLIVALLGGIWLAHRRGAFAAIGAKLQAMQQSPSWDWWVGALFGVPGFLVILWKVPQWQVAGVRGLDAEKRFDKPNEARKTLATILGGVAVLTGGYFTWRNFSLAQESFEVTQASQRTERYTKAVELLIKAAAPDDTQGIVVRLGGIYSLEAVANESRRLHWPVMEMLSGFVREYAPVRQETRKDDRDKKMGRETYPDEDVQAVLLVLGHRDLTKENPNSSLNLTSADLRGALLEDLNFDFANLQYADLKGGKLRGVHIKGAKVSYADFRDPHDGELTQSQIHEAIGNYCTKVPPNLCLPRHWAGVTPDTPRACPAPK